ncbi:MAG TPA: hypothetical protein ENK23_07610, partial [Sorangium sp.]|nr:hypothetical protein [Sorangium sp.]
MDPQMQQLVQRLVADPHDAAALAAAHQAGTQDPQSYATLLETVAQRTSDTGIASHWLNEAAQVWQSLGDSGKHQQLLMLAAERDPSNAEVVAQVVAACQARGDVASIVKLRESMCTVLKAQLRGDDCDRAAVRATLIETHQQLAEHYHNSGDGNSEACHLAALVDADPSDMLAIYS